MATNEFIRQQEKMTGLPKFHLGQTVKTPDGEGIIVQMSMLPTNGLYLRPELSEVVVWYGTGNNKGGKWVQNTYRLSELSEN